MSTSHNYGRKELPIKDQGLISKHTLVSDNVWIGAKATLLAEVKISKGTVIGANSVIAKDNKPITAVVIITLIRKERRLL